MIEQFRQHMLNEGFNLPDVIIADGKKHRFSTNEDPKDLAGEYCLYTDHVPAGYVRDYRTDTFISWCSKSSHVLSQKEKLILCERKESSKKEEKEAQEKAKNIARSIINAAKPACNSHQYLSRKQIMPINVLEHDGRLIVPIRRNDELISLQYIYPNGYKMFLPDSTISGGYFILGKPEENIFLVEGYATGVTVFNAMNQAVFVTFTSSNLVTVAKSIRGKYPNLTIVICADNDQWPNKSGKIKNIGIDKAYEAAKHVSGTVIHPNFEGLDITAKPTDFNDLMLLTSIHEVKNQISNAIDMEINSEDEESIQALPMIDRGAFFGVLEDFAIVSAQNSEAADVAVVGNLIARLCAMIGKSVHQWIGDVKIECRPFLLFIGKTGKARKGTSEYLVRRVFEVVESILQRNDVNHKHLTIHEGGLSSGEGIAFAIRDESLDPKAPNGIEDKRLLVIESEFANVLALCKREASTLSGTIRNLFDGKNIAPLTKHNVVRVTNPHVVILGHCTKSELIAKSSHIEINNGLLNRFFLCAIGRERLIPLPKKTSMQVIEALANEIVDIIYFIRTERGDKESVEITLSPKAEKLWREIYPSLSRDREGSIGALLARSEQYARMFAMIICVLDKKTIIDTSHVRSALHWMSYQEKSIEYLFGNEAQQREEEKTLVLAEKILQIIKNNPSISKSDINKKMHGHELSSDIKKALSYLLNLCPPLIREKIIKTRGRDLYLYSLAIDEKEEKAEEAT